ncbi:MAG TPA: hypothetical protein VG269_22025 [Tepidisphaeraceae bacterium]|nr:hypothetical protein [Tepidisphaeraceae bacterium]
MVRDTFTVGPAGDGSRYMLVSFDGALLAGSGKPDTVRGVGFSSVPLSNLPKEPASSSRDIFNAEFGREGKVSLAVPYPLALLLFAATGSWLQSRHSSIRRNGRAHLVVSAVFVIFAFAANARPASAGENEPPDSRIVASLERIAGIYKSFSPDRSRILTIKDGKAKLWDAGTVKILREFELAEYINGVAFRPGREDRRRLE